ncbi:MAG: sigma-70 family RNA polymerase sigma factor [Ruminococcus sp.]|nr:sigma-70 family RNA polymerase sigma factor [Ruminococcus sp.]
MDNGASSYRRFRDNGDVSGFDEIFMEYSDGLMLYLLSIVGNIWTAEELTEETFFLIGTKKPKFKEKCSFKTWLYTIGRNIALNYLKKNAKKPTVPFENAQELISDEEAVEDAYIKKEQQIIVYRAMRKLQPKYQQVLWLIYFEGLSNKEAAKVMKKSVRSTESILYRAKKSLRSQLEMEGVNYETT